LLYLIGIAVVIAGFTADSNYRIVTEEYTLSYENLPDAFSGYRIAQLSDLHGKEFGPDNSYLISKLIEAKPDIIAVTGDLIDDPSQLSWVRRLSEQLVDIAPVFYVTGNHEWPTGVIRDLFDILSEAGVTVLRNSYVELSADGESILLVGIEDPNGPADMKKPPEIVKNIRDDHGDKYMLLLVHRNDWLGYYSHLDVETAVCGHAHGGLVRLPFTDGLVDTRLNLFPTYTSGLYTEDGTDMIVSRGLGNSGKTFRFLNNPHIPIIILESK